MTTNTTPTVNVATHPIHTASAYAGRFLRRRASAIVLFTALAGSGFGALPAFAETDPININTAPAEALSEALSGVGIAKAYRIVEYREAHGPFEHIDELSEVKGIGAATVERNREKIVLQ